MIKVHASLRFTRLTLLYNNGCVVLDPLRVSESQSVTRKAATIEKVIESVNQAVSSSYVWSESITNED